MKKSIVLLLHLVFWFCFGSLLYLLLLGLPKPDGPDPWLMVKATLSIIAVPFVIAFYGFYAGLFSRFLKQKRILKLLGAGTLTALIAASVGGISFVSLLGRDFVFGTGIHPFLEQFVTMTITALLSGCLGLIVKGFVTWFDEQKQKEALLQKNHEIQLDLIKAQIDPHFLFNTLNNIDVLIQKAPADASAYLNKLSDIMRFMLFETKVDNISVTQEIAYLEKYLDLQRIRSSNPHFVKLETHINDPEAVLAPMVFMPFVENAFKHVADKKMDEAITISISVTKEAISFRCSNQISKHRKVPQPHQGLGNELIQKRLQLLYPNTHQLTISNQNGIYRVHLILERHDH